MACMVTPCCGRSPSTLTSTYPSASTRSLVRVSDATSRKPCIPHLHDLPSILFDTSSGDPPRSVLRVSRRNALQQEPGLTDVKIDSTAWVRRWVRHERRYSHLEVPYPGRVNTMPDNDSRRRGLTFSMSPTSASLLILRELRSVRYLSSNPTPAGREEKVRGRPRSDENVDRDGSRRRRKGE